MIIVKLHGGLGNQMFQYAFGRALSIHRNEDLKFDISSFPDPNNRKYCLDKLGLQLQFASADECYRAQYALQPLYWRLICRFFNKPCPPIRKSAGYFEEKGFAFNPSVFTSSITYASGYWQCEKYWAGYEDVIRREFSFNIAMSEKTLELAEKISGCKSVSVHFRRGDYVDNSATKDLHGGCSLAYYAAAVNQIAEAEKDIELYVFSDEPEWCRNNFKTKYPMHFVTHTAVEHDYEDIWMMSCCKHNIIANSSFSWWGAWLSQNPDKIVIAPRRWLADDTANEQMQDLIPKQWISL
jgi:hypothetical protein